jgi:hypothetical protein
MAIFPAVGDGLMINDEIMRVDAVDRPAGTITVGRGCMDSLPSGHFAGDRAGRIRMRWTLMGWNTCPVKRWRHVCSPGPARRRWRICRAGGHADHVRASGQTVSAGEYPGQWRLISRCCGQRRYFTLAFSHRDRLLQADRLIDCTENSIGPEPGTEYVVKLIAQSTGAEVWSMATSDASIPIPYVTGGDDAACIP